MSCSVLIVTTIIAFLIHPVIGVIWLTAQILGALNNKEEE